MKSKGHLPRESIRSKFPVAQNKQNQIKFLPLEN